MEPKPTVKVLRPARQLGDSSQYQVPPRRGGLKGSSLKKIIGELWNAIIRVCHLEMDIGNECCKYGLRRECSR